VEEMMVKEKVENAAIEATIDDLLAEARKMLGVVVEEEEE
jgi:hypothetical protein